MSKVSHLFLRVVKRSRNINRLPANQVSCNSIALIAIAECKESLFATASSGLIEGKYIQTVQGNFEDQEYLREILIEEWHRDCELIDQ
jgi:hypothetical protein